MLLGKYIIRLGNDAGQILSMKSKIVSVQCFNRTNSFSITLFFTAFLSLFVRPRNHIIAHRLISVNSKLHINRNVPVGIIMWMVKGTKTAHPDTMAIRK